MDEYTASIPFDRRLYPYDIAGSIAHARMLARQGIITDKEAEAIINGLDGIQREIEQGKFQFKPELEDIHMNIEARLIEKIGEVGGKLHTARSRNDQVALDMRLFVKDAIADYAQSDLRSCSGRLSAWPKPTKRWSCPAIPICSRRSRCCWPTTCWPISRCSSGISTASATA